jgi:hypothetical protein
MYQGQKPIDKILDVLDSVYGTVDNKEHLLAELSVESQTPFANWYKMDS